MQFEESIKQKALILLLGISLNAISQMEFSKWYFGIGAGLDFSSSPPTLLTNGIVNSNEPCASICDNGGNILFYTDGVGIANSAHAVMANGTGLLGNGSSTQGAMIIKQPGNATIYYVFTMGQLGSSTGLNYSIADMSLAAGLGSVTVKNATLYPNFTCEKQVAVRHCNGKDVWHLSHEYGSNNFRAYLITAAGISSTPVISSIGQTIAGNNQATIGQLKISPDGKKLAIATSATSSPVSLGTAGFCLFDFNAVTGVVSNSLILNSATAAYGLEFSPDGTKLYGTTPISAANVLYQWNICAASNSAILASQYSVSVGPTLGGAGSLQRAIDGKIYLAISSTQSLSVINNPNAGGAAMGFSFNVLSLAPKYSGLGLPNYINTYTKPNPAPFSNIISCQSASFVVPPVPTFSSGCTSTPYAPNGYFWNFGEPSSGTANTSTASSPNHLYATTGTYTVSLILLNPCVNDTLKQVITITTPGPTPAVEGPSLVCKGDKYTYVASGGSSYLWSTGSTSTSVALSPTQTTVYSVVTTSNGCSLSKSFTVTVDPCTGIGEASAGSASGIRVYPNPSSGLVSISVPYLSDGASLSIKDILGKELYRNVLDAKHTELSLKEFQNGLYFIEISRANGDVLYQTKLVKQE